MQKRQHQPEPTRHQVLAGSAGFAVIIAGVTAAKAQETTAASADFLFVQTANGMAFATDRNRLTLRGVSPFTLFFGDRPERIAGNMTTTVFVPFWSEGKDSFLSDPPNADLSIFGDGKLRQTVVTLHDPVIEGDDLSCTVKISNGAMPVPDKEVLLFIDVTGVPLTPLSDPGVRRRAFCRAAHCR